METMKMKDKSPVPQNDRERCAAVEAMGLKYLEPGSPTARALKTIVEMTDKLLDVALAEITYTMHGTFF
jgi:hypothetical protein